MNKRDWFNALKGAVAMLVVFVCFYAISHNNYNDYKNAKSTAAVTSSVDRWRLQDETETIKPLTDEQTVYWVDGGEVYHLSKNCRSLSRSTNIHSGTIAESGKERVCEICGK